jgi:hypothetical protein
VLLITFICYDCYDATLALCLDDEKLNAVPGHTPTQQTELQRDFAFDPVARQHSKSNIVPTFNLYYCFQMLLCVSTDML